MKNSKKKTGLVSIVGIGPAGQDEMSIGALKAIENADELWMQDLGPTNFEKPFLRKLFRKKKVINVTALYRIPGCPRGLLYTFWAQRVVHLARRGRRITYLFSGNPDVWVSFTDQLKKLAFKSAIELEIKFSMSFLDLMYSLTPLTVGEHLQVRLTSMDNPTISPEMDLVIGQIGDTSETGGNWSAAIQRAQDRFLEIYPPKHPLFLYGNHVISGQPRCVATTLDALVETCTKFTGWHFSALVPSLERAEQLQELTSAASWEQSSLLSML